MGTIQAPASKSSMQRACAAALLNQAETTILNPGHSNDDKAALGVIQALGAHHGQDYSMDPDQVAAIIEASATDHACPAGGTEIYTDEGPLRGERTGHPDVCADHRAERQAHRRHRGGQPGHTAHGLL